MAKDKSKIHTITECGLFTALICVLSPIVIPLGPVPFSLSLFVVALAASIADWKESLISVGVFILLGLVGLPVFSGFQGGISALMGPTGGFILSYIPVAALVALSGRRGIAVKILFSALALLVCYLLGTIWYMVLTGISNIRYAVSVCVLPFVPFDILKFALAAFLGDRIKSKL